MKKTGGRMAYVDGFVIPIPAGKIKAYQKIAAAAGKIWMDHGALGYMECVMEDENNKFGRSFKDAAATKKGETVLFSYIVYKSRSHRDSVNKKVMADKRMKEDFEGVEMPFDMKRMVYGGFKSIVEF